MSIQYSNNPQSLTADQLDGFFVDWPTHPTPEGHLEILQGSHKVWLAMHRGSCVGFINAISDGVFSAFIPLLEVLPEHQGKGVGAELVKRMVESLSAIYSIDIACDEEVAKFYDTLGFSRLVNMAKRNYGNQTGSPSP